MSDLISRQAAIDAINALHDLPNAWLDCAVDAVMELPSAQPEIIRCKDCRKWQTVNCPFFSQYKSVMPNEEQYCSLAERRNDGGN